MVEAKLHEQLVKVASMIIGDLRNGRTTCDNGHCPHTDLGHVCYCQSQKLKVNLDYILVIQQVETKVSHHKMKACIRIPPHLGYISIRCILQIYNAKCYSAPILNSHVVFEYGSLITIHYEHFLNILFNQYLGFVNGQWP